jgi:PST family polysaccharide transporter
MFSRSKSLFTAIKYTALAQYSNVFINLFIGAVLARLLTPSEYGTVAMVAVFVTFFGLLSDVGLSVGIVQFKELTKIQIGSLFNLSIIMGVVLSASFWLASYWIAEFYNNIVYIRIGQVLSLSILLRAMNAVPVGILRREKKFKEIGIQTVVISFVTGIIGIILAYKGFSYWALIYRMLLGSVFLFAGNFYLARIPLCFCLKLGGMKPLIKYSGFSFLFNFVNYFSRNLDNLLIGKYMGPAQLGFYDKAYTLMKLPLDNLMTVITPVLHPILSGQSKDKSMIIQVHLKLSKLLAIIGIPISVYVFYSRHEIISIIYGDQWTASAAPLKWLALSIWIQMILSSIGPFYLIEGKTNYHFLSGLLSAITMISAVVAGILYGTIEMVGFFLLIAFTINLFQGYFILYKYVLYMPFSTLMITLKNPMIIGIICFAALVPFNFISLGVILGLTMKTIVLFISTILGLLLTHEHLWVLDNLKTLNIFGTKKIINKDHDAEK